MSDALIPILVRHVASVARRAHRTCPREFLAAISTSISLSRPCRRLVKGSIVTRESGTGPRVSTYVEGVLMSLCFILIFEPISTVIAFILFFCFVSTAQRKTKESQRRVPIGEGWWYKVTYVNSSRVSNFLGFLGQHSHI